MINEKSITPDLTFYNFDNILIDFDAEDEISVSQIPLGVVEIMSPTQTITELIVKSHAFFDAGVKSYWLVIPSLKTIYVFSDKGEYEVYAKTGYTTKVGRSRSTTLQSGVQKVLATTLESGAT